MRVTQQQLERIIGIAGRGSTSARMTPERIRQALAAAASAARRGQFLEAETSIAPLPLDGPLGPATLDLKAKICAQQGRLVEAQFCWMEAVGQSPGNESYRRSLDCVTRLLRPSRLPMVVCAVAVVILAAIAVALADMIGSS